MRILFVTNKVRAYNLGFQNVLTPMLSLGHEVIWAANFTEFVGDRSAIPCKTIQIDINSYPFHLTNIKAYCQIKKILKTEKIDTLYTSTPIGSTLSRIAAWRCGVKRVVYAAHGFMFFSGAPLINRTVYKFPEVLLARVTDELITINEEDYRAAQKLRLRSGSKPYMIHGAGVNVGVIVDVDIKEKRRELGLKDSDIVVVSAGDLNPNKNYKVVIEAFANISNKNIHYLICGSGMLESQLRNLVKSLGIGNNVHFLGFRTDMPQILASSNIMVMPSFREGVPRAILEAMDMGLPCVGSKTRGIADLIEDGRGGYICEPNDAKGFADAIVRLADNPIIRKQFGEYNSKKAKGYSAEIVRDELTRIFKEVFA